MNEQMKRIIFEKTASKAGRKGVGVGIQKYIRNTETTTNTPIEKLKAVPNAETWDAAKGLSNLAEANMKKKRLRGKYASTTVHGNPREKKAGIGASILNDIIAGGAGAKGGIEMDRLAEEKLAQYGFTCEDVAKVAGALGALAEADYTVKEASEALGLPVDALQAVMQLTR